MIETKKAVAKLTWMLAGKKINGMLAIKSCKALYNSVFTITKDNDIASVALLYGVVDDSLSIDPDFVSYQFKLEDFDTDILNVLTIVPEHETEEEHFERILKSGNQNVLIIKLCACMQALKYNPHDIKSMKYIEAIKDVL